MPRVEVSTDISCGLKETFGAIANFSQQSQWNPMLIQVEPMTPGPVQVGSRFRASTRGYGELVIEVLEFQPEKRILVSGKTKMANMTHEFLFEETGSRVRFSQVLTADPKGFFKILTPFMGPMMAKDAKRAGEKLKEYLERKANKAA